MSQARCLRGSGQELWRVQIRVGIDSSTLTDQATRRGMSDLPAGESYVAAVHPLAAA